MDQTDFTQALQELRKTSSPRKFTQTLDLVVNLRDIDPKKDDQKVSTFLVLPKNRGRAIRITALVGQELITSAKAHCTKVVTKDEFGSFDKKAIKKLASETDFFIAQSTLMAPIASAFGKILGPRGKMPNPKAGCVIPPTADLKPVAERLQRTVRIETKAEAIVKVPVGTEAMKDDDLVANLQETYIAILRALPNEQQNVKNVLIKFTMSKPVKVGTATTAASSAPNEHAKEKEAPKKAKKKPTEKAKEP